MSVPHLRPLPHLPSALAALPWTAVGLAMPVAALMSGMPGTRALIGGAACMVLALVVAPLRIELGRGSHSIELGLETTFVMVAALLLPPPWAAIVGLASSVWILRARPLRRALLPFASASLAAAAASAGAALVAARPFDGGDVLPAALMALACRSVVVVIGHALDGGSGTLGGTVAVLRGGHPARLLVLEAGLVVALIAATVPWIDQPFTALGVIVLGQALVWAVLALARDEDRHRLEVTRLDATYARYVPHRVAQALARGGDAPAPGGEQRELTIMFVDIRSFTAWAERQQPDDVLTELNHLLGDLADAVLSTGGTLDKFTGDGLMAFWNAPFDQADHAARALRAVPAMLMRVREFNNRREVRHSEPLEIGIGVHTGQAMVGNLGHRDRLAYTAVGDVVNLTARLEAATRQADVPVLLSEATFLALPAGMRRQLQRLDSIAVKGRTERVRVYAPAALVEHLRRQASDQSARRNAG